jgi:uncharacterized protein (TIGR04255 family)
MKNAPLAAVVAEVRFAETLKIEERVPDLQEALEDKYPRLERFNIQTVEFGDGDAKFSPERRWDFYSAGGFHAVSLTKTALALHATEYADFDNDFSKRLAHVLSIFGRIVPGRYVERIGLRYIDLVIPRPGEQPEAYLNSPISNLSAIWPSAQLQQSASIFAFSRENRTTRFRCILRQPSASPIPPDFALPINLKKSARTEACERQGPSQIGIAVLDFDSSCIPNMTFDADLVHSQFSTLHDDSSELFKSVINDHARTEWNS